MKGRSAALSCFLLLGALAGVWSGVVPKVDRLEGGWSRLPRLDHSRIVGGEVATQGQFPFMVALFHRGVFGTSFTCGATILNENHFLTAAHCVKGVSDSSFDVVTGEQNLDDNSGLEVTLRSEYVEMHDFSTTTAVNDIAIIRTSTSLTLEPGVIEAVPLPAEYQEPAPGVMCTVVGWGYTEDGGDLSSDLRFVDVPYVDDSKCGEVHGSENIYMDMICAGYTGGRGMCNGDSGGPLMCEGVQLGIVSWGQDCDATPFVATQVSHYIDWINIFINS